MKKVLKIWLWGAALAGAAACSGWGEGTQPTAEEMRLERCCTVDTAGIRAVLGTDNVAGWERLSELSAEAWMLVDDSTGLLIGEKNATQRMYPASLTKMMTCLLALENGKMTDSIEISQDVFVTRDSRLRPGDAYVERNLIYEMMLQSDNVAAVALGKRIGGDTLAFCQMMNQKAAYLHMDSTRFANANGMACDSNYTTVRDLLTLTRYCMADSAFAEIVGTRFMDIPLIDRRHLPCQNTNLLLEQYEGCTGVKTGYTRQAGSCLAAAATRGNVTLVLVLLKSKSRASRFSEAATLLDYGFRVMEEYRRRTATSPSTH